MSAQEQIEHIATSGNSVDRLAMLKAMKHDTVTQSTLADQVGIARKTAHRFLRELDECLIDEHPDGYRLTGAGAIALHAFVTARNQLGREPLYSLAHSPSERVYLRLLSSQPMERAAIASVGDISRKTVDRLTSDFVDKRYVASTDAGTYDLSAAGDYVITAYDRLVQSFEQIFSNAVCLQCLDVGVETLPAHALTDESTLLRTRPGQSVGAVSKRSRVE